MTKGLPRDYIKVGNVIWYSGSTSRGPWDCPAEIAVIGDTAFLVRSLDDCELQRVPYRFVITNNCPESRRTMRIPSHAELEAFHREQTRFRTVKVDEIGSDNFVVRCDSKVSKLNEWTIHRWCSKNNMELPTYGLDTAMQTHFRFTNADDAALCLMTFSSGLPRWSVIE